MAPEIAAALAVAAPMAAAHAWTWVKLNARISKLEKNWENCEEKWAREVRRGAALAVLPVDPFRPPASLPAPDWEEPTGVRERRAELEREGLAEGLADVLREYLERTPPRGRLPSRPT